MDDYADKYFRKMYKPFMVAGAKFSGEFDIPQCPCTANSVPSSLVHYSDIDDNSRYEGFVHFYTYEYKFADVWENLYKALKKIQRCGGVITPDFSTYQDMPAALKIYNTYRMRAFAYWLGTYGVQVINNVRWGTPETFKYCFDGIPQNSIVCASTVGSSVGNKSDDERFLEGLEVMVETLKPRHILMYGNEGRNFFDAYIKRDIPVTFYSRKKRACPSEIIKLPINLTLAEFAEKYYLHDSSIDQIDYDEENRRLTLTIDFCFWMQRWYNKSYDAENGLITVTFNNVSAFECGRRDFENFEYDLDTEIDHTEIDEDGALKIIVREYLSYQPLEEEYWQIKINADNVTVIDLN